MSRIQDSINRVKTFFEEVRTELKKCAWPTRPELVDSTIMVVVSVVIIGLFVSASDVVLLGLLRLIIR
jgi:preprotein translocase subunit SecE